MVNAVDRSRIGAKSELASTLDSLLMILDGSQYLDRSQIFSDCGRVDCHCSVIANFDPNANQI